MCQQDAQVLQTLLSCNYGKRNLFVMILLVWLMRFQKFQGHFLQPHEMYKLTKVPNELKNNNLKKKHKSVRLSATN